MLRSTMACFLAGVLAIASVAPADEAPDRPVIEMAICLDTSSSMDGLIDAARQKLWAVVSDLGTARPAPVLRVALYQYGHNSLSAESGWVEQLCPLTDDLDSVYGKLFALRTSGGTEYVARVVSAATQQLAWSEDNSTLRMIVVAGNEAATQDQQVKLEDACKAAITRGIIINTIYCGPEEAGRNSGWADAARYADGRYSAISADGGTVVIATPYDEQLAKLSTQLNATYVAYGARGDAGRQNQQAQDTNAAALSPAAAAERAVGKAQRQYSNSGWDLVDAVASEAVALDEMEADALPDEMESLPPEQRREFIEQKTAERKRIQAEIVELEKKRQAFMQEEKAKQGLNDKDAFDTALRTTLREQAQSKGITFDQNH